MSLVSWEDWLASWIGASNVASVTVSAFDATVNVQPNAGNAAITLVANAAQESDGASAGSAALTASAFGPVGTVSASAAYGPVTVSAFDATVTISGANVNANAGFALILMNGTGVTVLHHSLSDNFLAFQLTLKDF